MAVTIRKGVGDTPQNNLTPVPSLAEIVALVSMATKRRGSGHTIPRAPQIRLDQQGRLRVANLLVILNVSHATFYTGLKSGRYPPPDGRDGSFPYWKTETIRRFLDPSEVCTLAEPEYSKQDESSIIEVCEPKNKSKATKLTKATCLVSSEVNN